ncbi:MAG: hypothetical protein IT350_04840 [Deltaproteobacteria bacterium]|nr:hypothetical protein [Deltaproteobacteria bacterium]
MTGGPQNSLNRRRWTSTLESRPGAWCALFVISIVHTASALRIFQPFAEFLRSPDFHAFDFCVLEQQIETARLAFDASGRLWGYDPRFLAGYIETFLWNSNVALQVLGIVLRPLSPGYVVKLATVLSALVLPSMFYLAWRWFGADRRSSLVGAVVGVVWFRATEVFAFWATGMTMAFLVFPVSLAGIAALTALIRGDRRGIWIVAIAPAALLIHKTAVVTLAIPALVVAALNLEQLGRRGLSIILSAVVVTLAFNAFWLFPLVGSIPNAAFDSVGSHWVNHDPWPLFRDLTDASAAWGRFERPNWVTALVAKHLAIVSGVVAWRLRRRIAMAPKGYLLAVLILAVGCYSGNFLPFLRPLDPSRYLPFVVLAALIPGADLLMTAARSERAWRLVAVAVLILLLVPSSPSSTFRKSPIPTGSPPELESLTNWINGLPGDARVHVEGFSAFRDLRPDWQLEFARLPHLLAPRVRRPMLGGFYAEFFNTYNFSNFASATWQGRPLDKWSDDDLAEQLRKYAVEYVVTWSADAGEQLANRVSVVEEITAPQPFRGWRVKHPATYFLKGAGRITAFGIDRLEIEVDETADDLVVLSFHWSPGLRAEGAEIQSVEAKPDPIPFIGLRHPKNHVLVTNEAAW